MQCGVIVFTASVFVKHFLDLVRETALRARVEKKLDTIFPCE
jgi:hypothetical protein